MIIDSRESQYRRDLAKDVFNDNIDVKTLDVGDYIINGLVFEFKNSNDFIASANDGRLLKQCKAMNREYGKDKSFLVLYENIHNAIKHLRVFGKGNFTEKRYLSLLAVITNYVNVIQLDNVRQAINFIKVMNDKYTDNPDTAIIPVKKHNNPVVTFLTCINNVSLAKANLIATELGLTSLSDLLSINKDDLLAVSGIGDITATNIIEGISGD